MGLVDASSWGLVPTYCDASRESAIEQYMGISPRNTDRLKKFGSIYYQNNGDNVTDFDVIIPMTIFYEWGSQKYYVKWHIYRTHGH
jgi:putative SOS response-associated peptidase YedK